jgi:hypothetical protein
LVRQCGVEAGLVANTALGGEGIEPIFAQHVRGEIEPVEYVGDEFQAALTIGALIFRHLPSGVAGKISGHLHPVARVAHRGRVVIRPRCSAEMLSRSPRDSRAGPSPS